MGQWEHVRLAKRQPAAQVKSSPYWGLKTFALTLGFVIALLSLGVYQVWQRYDLYSLGMSLSGETLRYRALLEDKKKLRLERATLKQPERIRQEAAARCGMRVPAPTDVVEIQ
jgi:cell division protein FtsL